MSRSLITRRRRPTVVAWVVGATCAALAALSSGAGHAAAQKCNHDRTCKPGQAWKPWSPPGKDVSQIYKKTATNGFRWRWTVDDPACRPPQVQGP